MKFTKETEVWSRLGGVLNLSRFPTLRDVTFHVSIVMCSIDLVALPEQLKQKAQVAFKNLVNEPSINFCFSVD
jgi:hypothetical protein